MGGTGWGRGSDGEGPECEVMGVGDPAKWDYGPTGSQPGKAGLEEAPGEGAVGGLFRGWPGRLSWLSSQEVVTAWHVFGSSGHGDRDGSQNGH